MSRVGEAVHNRSPQAAGGPEVFQGQVDPSRAHQDVLRGLDGKQVCPFCGSVSEKSGTPCPRCGMDNTPEARKATKARIGPWYVLQARNPAAPGMRFETLLSFVRKGRVRARSVVRGPTTHQLWRFAAHVKGLSREFGLCYSCGSQIETTANVCPQCNRLQEPPLNPDVLLEELGNAGADDAARPVYRELPKPGADGVAPPPDAVAAARPVPAAAPVPDDADIVIPALGGFGADDLDATFSNAPVNGAPFAQPAPQPNVSRPAPAQKPAARAQAAAAPQRPARDDNPFAIAPPSAAAGRNKKGNGDGAFLSAKELAAAFKLSFDPSADMDAVDVPDQIPAGALPDGIRPAALGGRAPASFHPSPVAQPGGGRRRGGFRKFLLFCLILAATGFGVLMWVDPALRAKTVEWSKATAARLRAYADGADKRPAGGGVPTTAPNEFDVPLPPARPVEPPALSPATTTAPFPSTRTGAGVDEPNPPTAAERPRPQPEREPEPEPQPQPAASRASVTVEPPPAVVPPPAPKESKRPVTPAPKAAPVAAKSQPAPAAAGSAGGGESDEIAKARTWQQLYNVAGRAERRGDYATALRAFEKVKALPADQQPTSIDLNLARVRRELKK